MGATSINHNCSLTWQAATEYKRPWSSAKRKAKAIYLLLLFRQSVPVFHSFCLIFDVESLLVLGHICQKVLDNHLNMYPEGIKNLPHEHVEVEHLLRILCINLLLLPVDGVARSKWWDLIPRLANMPNKCAFPWFIIAHSSCSQITSRRSNFRNKRAANAKAPCLQKTLHVRDVCIYSHATACTLHHLHVCVQICVYEIARNSSKAHDLWMSQATRLLHDMRLCFQIVSFKNVNHDPQDPKNVSNSRKKARTSIIPKKYQTDSNSWVFRTHLITSWLQNIWQTHSSWEIR